MTFPIRVVAVLMLGGCWTPRVVDLPRLLPTIIEDAEAQDRRANVHANAAAEVKRTQENAAIRETGKRLEREARDRPAQIGPVDQTLPERLTSSMISDGMAIVRPLVMSCETRSKGQLLVSIRVAAGGEIATLTIIATPDPTLDHCVGTALRKASFAKTQTGGSFRYPFVF